MSQVLYRIEQATTEEGPWTPVGSGQLLNQLTAKGTLGALQARFPETKYRLTTVEPVKFAESPAAKKHREKQEQIKYNAENFDTVLVDMYLRGASDEAIARMTQEVEAYRNADAAQPQRARPRK